MDVLVLSPCSSSKEYDRVAGCDPLYWETIDTTAREDLIEEYPEKVSNAAEMYTGQEHEFVHKAVDELRTKATVDWRIISAGFGLLRDDTAIPYYECSFDRQNIDSVRARAQRAGYNVDELTNKETIQAVGREKGILDDFRQVLKNRYDLVFVVLGKNYLLSVENALSEIPDSTTAYAFAADGNKEFIGDCQWVPATKEERVALETTWSKLRGKQLHQLATSASSHQLKEMQNDSTLVQRLCSG